MNKYEPGSVCYQLDRYWRLLSTPIGTTPEELMATQSVERLHIGVFTLHYINDETVRKSDQKVARRLARYRSAIHFDREPDRPLRIQH